MSSFNGTYYVHMCLSAGRLHTPSRLFIQFWQNSIHPPAVASYFFCCCDERFATIVICFLAGCLALRCQCLSFYVGISQYPKIIEITCGFSTWKNSQSLCYGFRFGLRTVNFKFLRHTSYRTLCNTQQLLSYLCMYVTAECCLCRIKRQNENCGRYE